MRPYVDILLLPGDHENPAKIDFEIANKLGIRVEDIPHKTLVKRSIDARKKPVRFMLRYRLEADDHSVFQVDYKVNRGVQSDKTIIVIGSGPAGYFAALQLLELGYKPIVLDRGKDVRARRRDLRAIQQNGVVDPDSNYCFGEGGAGTYSDGKLYTRSVKRGNVAKVLHIFVEHGAMPDILIDAHPHIGTNKLPGIVSAMRQTIENCGGEVHFSQKVVDILVNNGVVRGVLTSHGKEWTGDAVILATGHSARDIYTWFEQNRYLIYAKPFAMGVRVEHPQSLIDQIQYKSLKRHPGLPASSYQLVCQVRNKGVFSFCMCPGGLIVPAATAPGEIVVNGMSPSRRDSPFANSGIVVEVDQASHPKYADYGALANMVFQKEVEQAMFLAGDGSQKAPAMRLIDFIRQKCSSRPLPSTSYIPGIFEAPLYELLPDFITESLICGFKDFGKKMNGFLSDDAIVVGVESRTSAPVRIPRDAHSMMHPQLEGLFPCGEGAGYAGGIVSAALDGMKVAEYVVKYITS